MMKEIHRQILFWLWAQSVVSSSSCLYKDETSASGGSALLLVFQFVCSKKKKKVYDAPAACESINWLEDILVIGCWWGVHVAAEPADCWMDFYGWHPVDSWEKHRQTRGGGCSSATLSASLLCHNLSPPAMLPSFSQHKQASHFLVHRSSSYVVCLLVFRGRLFRRPCDILSCHQCCVLLHTFPAITHSFLSFSSFLLCRFFLSHSLSLSSRQPAPLIHALSLPHS